MCIGSRLPNEMQWGGEALSGANDYSDSHTALRYSPPGTKSNLS